MGTSTSPSERRVLKDCKEVLDILRAKGTLDYWRISSTGIPTLDGFRPNTAMQGFSDLLILMNGLPIFVEVKAYNGKQTDSQKEFAKRVEKQGGHYRICRSRDDLLNALDALTKR